MTQIKPESQYVSNYEADLSKLEHQIGKSGKSTIKALSKGFKANQSILKKIKDILLDFLGLREEAEIGLIIEKKKGNETKLGFKKIDTLNPTERMQLGLDKSDLDKMNFADIHAAITQAYYKNKIMNLLMSAFPFPPLPEDQKKLIVDPKKLLIAEEAHLIMQKESLKTFVEHLVINKSDLKEKLNKLRPEERGEKLMNTFVHIGGRIDTSVDPYKIKDDSPQFQGVVKHLGNKTYLELHDGEKTILLLPWNPRPFRL